MSSLVNDMTNDNTSEFEEKNGYYIIKNKVNYPNNEDLTYEKVYFDKSMTIKKVEVYNNQNIVKIKVEFSNVNMKASLDEDDFDLSKLITEPECSDNCDKNNQDNIDSNSKNNTDNKTTASIEDVIYPLYVPENTSLKSKDVINTEDGERVILTFSGDNGFVLVQETMNVSDEFEIIPVYGDPQIINDSIGALSANSLSWTSNNVNYYLTGTTLSKDDLINIATSMNNVGVVNAEK